MNFPDRVFAVGGAGKAVAFKILESDWIVEEILEPRPNPLSVTVTIIDTAEGEQNSDRERIQEVRERISRKEAQFRDSEATGRTGSLDVEYKLITDDIYLSGTIDLLGDDAVPRITDGNGMDREDWWLKDAHVNENLDFAKGVVRKRGLGKAIYYKAYAEDDDLSTVIDLPEKGQVAFLAGLGGGTGSGILLDLAQHLQERQRTAEITLFGVLPNHNEGLKENTNAYAALSELEYDALNGADIFKNRILVPIDPTNFDGKTGDTIQTGKYLEELDEAVVYLITSFYNTQGLEDPFANSPDYAPFTIGVPQVLRYNVQAINEAREDVREILQTKEEALEIERDVYTRLDRFLTKHYGDEPGGLRDKDRTKLNDRLQQVRAWLDFDLFEELEYQSLEIYDGIISDAEEEADDIADQIDLISSSMRAVTTTGAEAGTFVDSIDEHLAEVLETELETLGTRKELLQRRNNIDDNRIREVAEYLVGTGESDGPPGLKLQRLESKRDDLVERREELEAEFESVVEELEQARDEQSETVERRTREFMSAVEADLDQLERVDIDRAESALAALVTELQQFARAVTNASHHDEVERVDESEVVAAVDDVEAELGALGMDVQEYRQDVVGSLEELRRAKKAFLTMMQEPSTLDKLKPWESSVEERQNEANKDFRMQRNRLAERDVFEVGPPTGQFAAEVVFDETTLLDQVSTQRARLTDAVLGKLEDHAPEVEERDRTAVEEALAGPSPDTETIEEQVRAAIRREVGETGDIEQRRDSVEADLEEVKRQLEVYEPAIELFEDVSNRRDEWGKKTDQVTSRLSQHDDDTVRSIPTDEEEYVYIKNIQPEDIFKATGSTDIADSDLFASETENNRLRSTLEELARNARKQEYTGLRRRKIAHGNQRYGEQKVRVAAMSRAISQIEPEALDFADTFRGAFDLGASGKRVESPFTSWRVDAGGEWDISLSVFITGVFLDNIRKVVQADGYKSGYDRRAQELGEDILIHHSYKLDDGEFVRRNGLLNMEDETDREFYLRSNDEVVSDLNEEFYETVSVQPE